MRIAGEHGTDPNANCCSGGGYTHALIGLEGQQYLSQITLYGQGGIQTNLSDGDQGGNYRVWFLRGVGRYYVDPNLKIEAFAVYANGRATSYDFQPSYSVPRTDGPLLKMDVQQVSWGIGAERRFYGTPFSGFVRYEGNWTELKLLAPEPPAANARTTEHAIKAGFHVYINEDSLLFNDRSGTTLDIRDPFTSIYRATGRTWIGNVPF